MIPTLDGWSTELLPRGIAMTHPDGAAVAAIVYDERARPLRRLGALVHEALGRVPGWVTEHLGAPERLATVEGEHAALVTVEGRLGGEAIRRALGFVFGDDCYSCTHGAGRAGAHPDLVGLVRELTRRDTHVRGIRRRRFEYEPPSGWQPIPLTGLAVQWLGPAYPRDASFLRVFAAAPHQAVDGLSLDGIIHSIENVGLAIKSRRVVGELSVRGLVGSIEEIRPSVGGDRTSVCRLALLRDERYLYPIEMWTGLEVTDSHPHWSVLGRVVESVVPLPAPTPPVDDVPGLQRHWLD